MTHCVVIDDEQPARELITMHLSSLADFKLVASFDNAVDGFNFLQKTEIGLLFLDIQMPGLSGVQLIRSLKHSPKVILTTAYREYAAEAFELDVLDYLVKPITKERFLKAISKFNDHHTPLNKYGSADSTEGAYIFLKTGKTQTKVYLKDIIYVEGLKDFTKVHTSKKTFVASERLSYMLDKLPENRFARIHKCYIVALDKITSISLDEAVVDNKTLPIGRIFKQEFLKKIKSLKLY